MKWKKCFSHEEWNKHWSMQMWFYIFQMELSLKNHLILYALNRFLTVSFVDLRLNLKLITRLKLWTYALFEFRSVCINKVFIRYIHGHYEDSYEPKNIQMALLKICCTLRRIKIIIIFWSNISIYFYNNYIYVFMKT